MVSTADATISVLQKKKHVNSLGKNAGLPPDYEMVFPKKKNHVLAHQPPVK